MQALMLPMLRVSDSEPDNLFGQLIMTDVLLRILLRYLNNMVLSDADDRIGQDAILHGVADNDSAVCQDWYVLSATDPNYI